MNPEEKLRLMSALRRRFPTMDLKWFYELVHLAGGPDHPELIPILEEEEAKAIAALPEAERDWDRRVRAKMEQLLGSALHLELALEVPETVDREHVQALLVYGFLMPTNLRTFSGAHFVPAQHVRTNVENKLIFSFDEGLFIGAQEWLLRNGVLNVRREGRLALSFNVDENRAGVSVEGRKIIQAGKAFLHEKERRKGGDRRG